MNQLGNRIVLSANEEARDRGEDVVPHQRLMIVHLEALENAHGDKNTGWKYYG